MAIREPSMFKVSSIAILQHASTVLRYVDNRLVSLMGNSTYRYSWSLGSVLGSSDRFRRHLTEIKSLYEVGNVVNILKDGSLPYPSVELEEKPKGMGFEMRWIIFHISLLCAQFLIPLEMSPSPTLELNPK